LSRYERRRRREERTCTHTGWRSLSLQPIMAEPTHDLARSCDNFGAETPEICRMLDAAPQRARLLQSGWRRTGLKKFLLNWFWFTALIRLCASHQPRMC
jgi:hypothetical protein